VGTVAFEREVTFTGEPVAVRINTATLSIPKGAVPPGTPLLIRFLIKVGKTYPGAHPLDEWRLYDGMSIYWPAVLQILPATVTFAAPATLTVDDFPMTYTNGVPQVDVFRADEGDAGWQRRGAAPVSQYPIGHRFM
jgi:hypothetical protein